MAVTIDAYDQLIELMSDGTIDMDDATADTFKMVLGTDVAFNATHTALSSITQIPNANGYTTGGASLTTVVWTISTGTITWGSDQVSWTASGGAIPSTGTCGAAVIYDETVTSPVDAVMIHIDFGADESAGDGTDFIVAPNASGWFTGAFTGA